MESFQRNIDGFYDVENQLPDYLRRTADRQFAAADRERARFDSREAVRARREEAQEYFFQALGGLPSKKTNLNATCTGTLDREGYVIEKVIFESLPDFHVTANLYLPTDRDGTDPGILFFCGHADEGKAAPLYQQACVDLVRNGFVVLAVDPLGQGERHQFYNPETGDTPRRNTIEHSYLGHQCQLAGMDVARYFVWDCIRSLDYLASRPEVDINRIGATGNSGGGMQTGYLMLADGRLAAAAPCCFVTSKEDYMKTGQAQDGEQILHRAIERGPHYDDFIATFAPKPTLIGAAQSDFLCIEGVHRTYERARTAYERFDAADAIDLTVAPTTHGLSPHLRAAVVNWFRVHLQGRASTFETDDPDIETVRALQCLTNGEVNAAYADERNVVDFTREHVEEHISSSSTDAETVRTAVRDRFGLDRETCRRFPRTISRDEIGDLVWEKVFFWSESEIIVTGIIAHNSGVSPPPQPTLVLLEHGTDDFQSYKDAIADLAREHGVAMVFDPRGVGGVRARNLNTPLANGGEYYDYHGTEYKLASDALMLGTSLIALRTFDVLQAADYLRNRFDVTELGIIGAGTRAMDALFVATADPTFRSVTVEDVPTFRERATTEEVDINHGLLVHDVVAEFDTPRLVNALTGDDVHVERIAFPTDGFP